jgi:hypothetical protein
MNIHREVAYRLDPALWMRHVLSIPPRAWHLRFAQPRAIGLKVSDEFTVPLCRGHHRQLHQAGNEETWWEDLQINSLEVAKGLWERSRPASTTRHSISGTE